MDWDEDFVKRHFERLTADEERAFSHTDRREMAHFTKDVSQSDGIRPAHLSYFNGIMGRFAAASNVFVRAHITDLSFENAKLKDGSLQANFGTALCAEESYGKKLYAIHHYRSSIAADGLFASIRPLPVRWNLDHIQERAVQRQGKPINLDDTFFMRHHSVALAMLRIYEDEFVNGPNTWHPFILPERQGILLGHTMHINPLHQANRFMFMAVADWESFHQKLAQYERLPAINMTVRTFIGEAEMTPAQKLLRQKLLPYYGGIRANSLQLEVENFDTLVGHSTLEEDPRIDDYFDNVIDLSELMKTSLWQQATRLPKHFYDNEKSSLDFHL